MILRAWKPAILLLGDAFDRGAFGQAAPAMVLEHAEMNQYVAFAVVADEEAEAARRVEPFDPARHRLTFSAGSRRPIRTSRCDLLLSSFRHVKRCTIALH